MPNLFRRILHDIFFQAAQPFRYIPSFYCNFFEEQGNAVTWGIIAEAFRCGLDPTDEKQRGMATAYLLEKVSWTGIASEFKRDLTAARTRQLCDAMTVTKDLMANLLLSADGRSGFSTGGGGSNGELTNWDGTKKKTGWEMLGEDATIVVLLLVERRIDGETFCRMCHLFVADSFGGNLLQCVNP